MRSNYASSSTSLEDDAADQKITFGKHTYEKPRAAPAPPAPAPAAIVAGVGSALWARVASAAGNLTVNVSKAWSANIATYVGEETPPGQESRLTRALKEYHIAKARDLAELPDWLFDERERRAGRAQLTERAHEIPPVSDMPKDTPRAPERPPTPAGTRAGERRIPVRPKRPDELPAPAPTAPRGDYTPPPALDRIKSTRLAKRAARVHFADDVEGTHREEEPVRNAPPVRPVTPMRVRTLPRVQAGEGGRPRMGLPTSVRLQRG